MLSCSLILEFSLPPLSCISFHFMYFKALLLGTDAFRIAMLSWCICCRKGDPFQGPKLGSCLTLRNELSEETHADKARDFIGKGTRVESRRVREPRRTALLRGSRSRVLW